MFKRCLGRRRPDPIRSPDIDVKKLEIFRNEMFEVALWDQPDGRDLKCSYSCNVQGPSDSKSTQIYLVGAAGGWAMWLDSIRNGKDQNASANDL